MKKLVELFTKLSAVCAQYPAAAAAMITALGLSLTVQGVYVLYLKALLP